MIPAAFDYVAATAADEAVAALAQHGDDAKLLAGGMSLIPLMKLRLATPAVLVDVGRMHDLSYVRDDGDHVAIGALTRHHELATSDVLARECGVISAVAAEIGDPQVRHRGTIGGSVAHGDPASDLPAVLLALDATVTARGPTGDRTIAAADLFVDFLETSLRPDELLTEIRVPEERARRLRVREVQPAGSGLGNRRRSRGPHERRHARRPREHGEHSAPRTCRRARAGRRCVVRRCRGSRGRRNRTSRRPQRHTRVPSTPRAVLVRRALESASG